MADVPRSISLSKNHSNVGRSKHIYDGVFSAPTATKRNTSTFSIRIDDYLDIFSPSDASLGSSIPIFDLPAVDRSDIIGRGRSSGIDYAGVFGGLGDDDQVGVPTEMLFCNLKKKAKADSHPSRSSKPTKVTGSRSQEFPLDSGNKQASKSLRKTRTTVSKSQEICGSTKDIPTPSQISESTKEAGTSVSEGLESSCSSNGRDNTLSSQASKTPTQTRVEVSNSQELCVNSRENKVSADHQFDGIKHSNIPSKKVNQSSQDAAAEIIQIAHLHPVVEHKANQDTDLSTGDSKGKRQGKQTRSVSDLGKDKKNSDHDGRTEFRMGKSNTFNATHSMSPVSNSAQLFGSNDYFRRSYSQRSKSSTESQKNDGCTSPLLELDVNSTAAASVAAVERAIEEAEAKIRRAKEFLKGHECDGSTHLSFKRSLKVKPVSNTCLNQKGISEVEEERLPEQKGHFDATVISENVSSNEAGGLKLKEFTTSESELPDEVGVLNENLYGVSAQEDTTIDPIVCVNDAKFVGNENSSEVVTSSEKSYKDEKLPEQKGHLDAKDDLDFTTSDSQLSSEADLMLYEKLHGVSAQEDMTTKHASLDPEVCVNDAKFVGNEKYEGAVEWEAAKHISQIISGVKNRFVSFISKQVETEKIEVQDIASSSRSVEQFEGSTCQVQDQVEKDDEMINDPSSGFEEIVHGSNICMNMNRPEEHITLPLEEENVVDDVVFQDVDVLLGQQCDLSVEITGKLIQEEIGDQNEEILDECSMMEHETGEDVQDQELVEEGCSLRETEMPKEDFEMVEKTYTDEFQETEQEAGLCTGVTKVADDSIEHDEQKLEDCRDELQEAVHATELFTESIVGVNKVTDDISEHDEKKLDDAQIVEDDCTDRLEGVQVAELFQDVKGKSTLCVTEVTDDEEKLEVAQMVEKTCTDKIQGGIQVAEVFTWEDKETAEFQDVEGKSTVGVTVVTDDEKKLEGAQMAEETCTDKLQGGVQVAEVFTWEDNEKIDTSEHDDKKVEDDQTAEETCTDKLQRGVQVEDNEDDKKIDTSEHDEKKFEDDQTAEETCTDNIRGEVQVEELFTSEDNETFDFPDIKGKSTVGVTEVIDDEKKLEDAQMVEETCTDKLQGGVKVAKVFTWEDNDKIDMSEHDEKKLGGNQMADETCTDKLQGGVQVAELFTLEANETVEFQDVKGKSTVCVTEVIDDEKKLEDAQMAEEICTDKLQGGVQVVDDEDTEKIDTFEHGEKKLDDDQTAEEMCTDKIQGGVQVAEFELFTGEDNEAIEHMNVESKITIAEVIEDSYDHDEKKLQDDEIIEETCTVKSVELFTREDNELIEHQNVKSESALAQHVRSCSGGEEKIEELATSAIVLNMNDENTSNLNKNIESCLHDISSHLGSSSGAEEESIEPYPSAVADDVSHTCDQEQSSMMRNVDAGLCDDKDQCPQDVDSMNFAKVMVEELKTEGNIHQASTICTIHDLIKKEMYEQTECSPPADEILESHEDECSISADACKNEVNSFLTGDNEGYRHDDADEHIEFSCEGEKMAESVVAATSEPEFSTEQPVTVEKTQCETDMDFEQEYTCEEVFPVDTNSENQGNETEFQTDVGEVDSAETSCKRKQWFVNRTGILLDQEITQGATVDAGEETKGNKRAKESGEDTNASQNDACSSAGDVCHITEAYHRRRRWFENRDQEVLSKPIVLDGAGITTQIDDQIAQDSELVNEGENSTAKSDRRRRRWFESGEKLEPIQKPIILEGIGVASIQEENTETRDETDEKNNRNQVKRAEKEKRRERKAVQRAIREARERAFVDAQERAAIEARQKAATQDKQAKVSSEPKSVSETKAAMEAKLREERAAVERATSEARERAMQKAIFEKAASMSKEKGLKNHQTSTSYNPEATFSTARPSGVVSESPQRRKAISERHKRTMERAAKALEEKNMRDFLAQKEEAERNRLADALDVDVKRWLTGKEGNLQAMLSTLQNILGPDSGWQPIPLTELMTSTTVRKAYKRAALCVHPDKLQQRGATIQQKYICEKVFDLLKDAWHKFNPDDW